MKWHWRWVSRLPAAAAVRQGRWAAFCSAFLVGILPHLLSFKTDSLMRRWIGSHSSQCPAKCTNPVRKHYCLFQLCCCIALSQLLELSCFLSPFAFISQMSNNTHLVHNPHRRAKIRSYMRMGISKDRMIYRNEVTITILLWDISLILGFEYPMGTKELENKSFS